MTETKILVETTVQNPVQVSASEFKGKPRADVRHYYENDGELRPTQKGINIPLDEVPALIAALEQLLAEQE